MPSDYESGAKKTIDISIKAEKLTADVLKDDTMLLVPLC